MAPWRVERRIHDLWLGLLEISVGQACMGGKPSIRVISEQRKYAVNKGVGNGGLE